MFQITKRNHSIYISFKLIKIIQIKLFIAFYDGWIGYYYDQKNKHLYIALIPFIISRFNIHKHEYIKFYNCDACPKYKTMKCSYSDLNNCTQHIWTCICGKTIEEKGN